MSDKPTTQTTVVEHESVAEQMIEGKVDTLDSKARYLAYAGRLRTALVASSRYLAYTSEVGEAFRPIVPPFLVTAAYGISWAYLGLDVAYEGYKTHHAGKVKGKNLWYILPTVIPTQVCLCVYLG
jgi:fission process protein 1